LRELQKEFDVTLVAFSRRNHQRTAEARRQAREALAAELSAVAEPVPIASESSRFRQVLNHSRTLVSAEPYTYFEYADRRYAERLRGSMAGGEFALAHVDSLDLYRWLDSLPKVPVACTHHNIESDLLRLRAERQSNPALAAYIRLQARLMEAVERRVAPRLDLNVMMSAIDEARLQRLAPGARTSVAPNGVDTEFFQPRPDVTAVPGRIVFLGPSYMFANRDGVDFFLRDIWPQVRARRPDATLRTIGGNPPADKARFESSPGVTCLGYVPDVRPPLAEASCSIVPLRVGGGTRLKILDAWAMGKAIVSTSIGCEGLDVVDGENILIRDDPASFAEAVLTVLSDRALRERLEAGGRESAVRTYSWPIIGDHLRRCYFELLATPAR
jgi:glycosyltransferase involved in cell wall biosynthesis